MKSVLLLSFFTLFSSLLHAESLSGVLQKRGDQFFLTLSQNGQVYQLNSVSIDATAALLKLGTGDYITGSGTLDNTRHSIDLRALDYVGLSKLLGRWYTGDAVMNFTSFSSLSVYSLLNAISMSPLATPPPLRTEFRYSTAPYYGDRWALFLSDADGNTSFATLEVNNLTVVMRTVNPQTGAILRTLRLVRWGY